MNRIFNPDNIVFSSLSKLVDIVALSILWAVFSIPIITIGASTSALYYTMTKTIRHSRGYVFRSFWGSFKASFKQATPIWIGYALVMTLMYFDASISAYFITNTMFRTISVGFFFAIMLIGTFWIQFVFPYIARFSIGWKLVCKNSAALAVKHFPFTILLMILEALVIFVALVFPIGLLFMPSLWAWLSSLILERIFVKYMSPEDKQMEDERNMKFPRN